MPKKLTAEILSAAIEGYEAQKSRLNAKIAELRGMLDGGPSKAAARPEAARPRRKRFSAAARRQMKEAQQRRWAKSRGESEPLSAATPNAPKPKRKLSAAGRKAIIDATKK